MTAKALRSRMLRKHPKRIPAFSESRRGFVGGLANSIHNAAEDGKFGPTVKSLTDVKGGNENGGNSGSPTHGGSNNGGGNNNDNEGGNNNNGGDNNNNGGGNGGNSNTGGNNGGNDGDNPPPGVDGDSSGNSPPPSPSSPSENSGGSTSNDSTSSSTGPSLDSKPLPSSASDSASNTPSSSLTRQSNSSSPFPTISVSAIAATASPSNIIPSSVTSAPSSTSTDFAAPQANLSKHSSRSAIAGGVVGALVFIFLILVAWMIYKRRRQNRLPPSAEFINNPASYPFARAGFSNITNGGEKIETSGGNYGGAGTGAAGQANFKPFSVDFTEGILSEKAPEKGQYRDGSSTQPLPEVLYTTPARVSTPPNIPAAGPIPGTPTAPSGRRIPFGTGTFQFPPRSSQSRLPRHGSPL